MQRFYPLEVGNDHEIWRNLKDGHCYVPQPNVEKFCYYPDTGTNLKVKISEGSEALRHMKFDEAVCQPPVWRMLRKSLHYFVFFLAELDTRKCERVVAKMACVEKEQ